MEIHQLKQIFLTKAKLYREFLRFLKCFNIFKYDFKFIELMFKISNMY